jgi:hypothetical protein
MRERLGEVAVGREFAGELVGLARNIRAQHFSCFVRIANNTNRILSERSKLYHHRASGTARYSDYRNRHRYPAHCWFVCFADRFFAAVATHRKLCVMYCSKFEFAAFEM